MITRQTDFVDILRDQFDRRKARNRGYSRRAYARDLGLSASGISQILSRKAGLSKLQAKKIADRLHLTDIERDFFCLSAESRHARSRADRGVARDRLLTLDPPQSIVADSDFKIVASWKHFAALELVGLSGFHASGAEVAKRLGIDKMDAAKVLKDLLIAGLLCKNGKRLVRATALTVIPGGRHLRAGKAYHCDVMRKAKRALRTQPIERREFSTSMFRVRRKDFPLLKERLKTFRRNIIEDMESGEGHDDVCCLGMQLFGLIED